MPMKTPDVTIATSPAAAADLAEDLDEVLLAAGSKVRPDTGKRLAQLSVDLVQQSSDAVKTH